jgi:hypothetical protein
MPYYLTVEVNMQDPLIQKSIKLGSIIGSIFGGILGLGLGAITVSLRGIVVGGLIGVLLGIITGILIGYLTAKTAGTTGGVSTGAYTGMAAGALFGGILGALIPTSLKANIIDVEQLPILEALVLGRFETAVLFSFMLCVLAMIIGAYVSGKNLVPRDTSKKKS